MKPNKPKQFVSNENISVDLFQNQWLNKLTRTHIAIPVTMFLLYAAGLLYYTKVTTDLANWQVVSLFFGGALFFTFAEYCVHRWLYHPPHDATDKYKEFTYKIHGIHHDYPKDKQRLAMPPVLTVIVGTLLLLLFELILDVYSFSFLAGFMTGYAMYLLVHYAVHIFKAPNNMFKGLWTNHAIHHYSADEVMFGVSNPLWDYVFGTLPKKKPVNQAVEVRR